MIEPHIALAVTQHACLPTNTHFWQDEGIPSNLVAYNSAIRACATRKLWPISLSLFEDLKEDGVKPSVISYNAALAACERGGQWEEARSCPSHGLSNPLFVESRLQLCLYPYPYPCP